MLAPAAKPRLSRLESLPTELLEQILLQSRSVNFLLASLQLRTVLFSTRTGQTIVSKFLSGNIALENLPQKRSAKSTRDTEKAIGELRSQALACPLMTWAFFKLCMKATSAKFSGARFGTNIPLKLLHGPWTENRLSFLYALNKAGPGIDAANSTHREMAKKGLTEAIREDNYRAVQLITDVWDTYGNLSATDKEGRSVRITPDGEHLNTAVVERGCRKNIVKRVLWALPSDVICTDGPVMVWARGSVKNDVATLNYLSPQAQYKIWWRSQFSVATRSKVTV